MKTIALRLFSACLIGATLFLSGCEVKDMDINVVWEQLMNNITINLGK